MKTNFIATLSLICTLVASFTVQAQDFQPRMGEIPINQDRVPTMGERPQQEPPIGRPPRQPRMGETTLEEGNPGQPGLPGPPFNPPASDPFFGGGIPLTQPGAGPFIPSSGFPNVVTPPFESQTIVPDQTSFPPETGAIVDAVPEQIVEPQVIVDPNFNRVPKLGFQGQFIHDIGMRVLSVNYGTPAQICGLETGDVILRINNIRLHCKLDYIRALREAANYHNGRLVLLVKNVRAQHSRYVHSPRYVKVTAWLPGYAPLPKASTCPNRHSQVVPRTRLKAKYAKIVRY